MADTKLSALTNITDLADADEFYVNDALTSKAIAWSALKAEIEAEVNHDNLAGFVAGEHFTQAGITTVGTVTTGVWNGTDIAVADGGTGASDAATARTNLGAGTLDNVVEDTTPQLGGDLDANGKNITDVHELRLDAVPDTDHTANGPTTDSLNAGATLAIGDLVYLNGSGQWALTDADAEATSGPVMLGIALAAATSGNPVKVALSGAFVRDDSWAWTVGAELFVGLTAGDLTETAPSATGDIVRVAGYAVSADVVYFLPSGTWVEIA